MCVYVYKCVYHLSGVWSHFELFNMFTLFKHCEHKNNKTSNNCQTFHTCSTFSENQHCLNYDKQRSRNGFPIYFRMLQFKHVERILFFGPRTQLGYNKWISPMWHHHSLWGATAESWCSFYPTLLRSIQTAGPCQIDLGRIRRIDDHEVSATRKHSCTCKLMLWPLAKRH